MNLKYCKGQISVLQMQIAQSFAHIYSIKHAMPWKKDISHKPHLPPPSTHRFGNSTNIPMQQYIAGLDGTQTLSTAGQILFLFPFSCMTS